jgi:hypothetical protein
VTVKSEEDSPLFKQALHSGYKAPCVNLGTDYERPLSVEVRKRATQRAHSDGMNAFH